MPLTPEKEIIQMPEQETVKDITVGGNQDYQILPVNVWLTDADGETATNYPIFFVPPFKCFLISATIWFDVDGVSGGSVDVKKRAEGVARGSGVTMLASAFNTDTGASKTVQVRGPSTVLADAQLDVGDAVEISMTASNAGIRYLAVTCMFGINNRNIPVSKPIKI